MKKYQLPLKNNFFSQQNSSNIPSALNKISVSITPTSKLQGVQGKRTPSNSSNNRNGKSTKTESSPSQIPSTIGIFNHDSGSKENVSALTSRNEALNFKQFSANVPFEVGKKKATNNVVVAVRSPIQPSQLQHTIGMSNSSGISLASTAFFPKSNVSLSGMNEKGKVQPVITKSPVDTPKISSADNNNLNNKTGARAAEKFVFSINGVPGFMTVATAKGFKPESLNTFGSSDENTKQKPFSICSSKHKEHTHEMNDDSIVMDNRDNQFVCQVHHEKKAKYLAAENGSSSGKIPYCSKCAIDLALKGVRVFQIFDEEKHRSPRTQLSQYQNTELQDSIQDSALHTPKGGVPLLQSNLEQLCTNSNTSPNQNNPIPSGNKNFNTSLSSTCLGNQSSSSLGAKVCTTPSLDEENEKEVEEEELVRKVELEKFLTKLDRVKINNTNSLTQIGNQKKEMLERHDRQMKRIQDIYLLAIRVIEEGFKHLIKEAEDSHKSLFENYFRFEEQIALNLAEMDNIKNDIAMNLEKILKHMNLKPFKIICSKYEEKLDSFEQINKNFMESGVELKLSQLALNGKSLQSYELEFLNFLDPFLKTSVRRFKILETKHAFLEEKCMDMSDRSSASKRTNTVYVSFENKDIFHNEIKASRQMEEKDVTQATQGKVLQVKDLNIKVPNELVALGNKKDVSLSLEMQSPRSLLNKTKDLIAHSSLAGRLSTLDSKESSPPKVTSSKKYLNLLEKVNTTQSNTNMLCNSIIKSNSNFSPDMFMDELSPKRALNEGKENYFKGSTLKSTLDGSGIEVGVMRSLGKPGSLLAGGNNFASRILVEDLKTKHPNKGEIKNYENFFHFIENKVNDESKSPLSSSYQKTLFCSPHFKDHETEKESELEI